MKPLIRLSIVLGLANVAVPTLYPVPAILAADAAANVKPLGDLSAFIAIAKEAQKIAKEGDFAKARARIKDLEKAWDDAEDQFRQNNSDGWRDADRKIDKSLDKLRDSKPDAQAVSSSLDALVSTLERLHKSK